MTPERNYLLDIGEIRAIRFECGKCGALLVIRPADFKVLPRQCPECSEIWTIPQPGGYQEPMLQFATGLKRLREQLDLGLLYRVRLEVDRLED